LSEAKPIKFAQADDGFRKGSTHPTGGYWGGHPETLTNAILIALAGPMKTPLQPSELHKGPIRRPVLPESYVDRIKAFKAILSDVDPTPLETAIDNFKRDANPEEELAIWERIANTYQLFLSHNAVSDPAISKEVFAVLIGASMGSEDWSNINKLNSEQINYLVANYRGL
jgi:hypothetical protein